MGMIAIPLGQRPSVILREEDLIPDEPGLWNLILDSRILANTQRGKGEGSLSDEIEESYRKFGIRGAEEWPLENDV